MGFVVSSIKTLFRIFIGIVGTVFLLVVAFLVTAGLKNSAPNQYTTKVKTSGSIESGFMASGDCSVGYSKVEKEEPLKYIHIYYPEDIQTSQKTYPLVVMANGTGVLPDKYKAVFRHLASWGFVVCGNDDPSTGSGVSTDETLSYMLSENSNEGSFLYGKLDVDNIAVVGHSQGGAAVLMSVSRADHKDLYKTAVALSPTHEEFSHQLGWGYALDEITIPVLMLAGTEGDFETQMVLPIEAMKAMFQKLGGDKVMARRTGADHGQMLYSADGYVTAWLMWKLKGDSHAAEAFVGENPEILSNPLYQDVYIDE